MTYNIEVETTYVTTFTVHAGTEEAAKAKAIALAEVEGVAAPSVIIHGPEAVSVQLG